ncbi:hypothetical protein AYL99_08664 [Fonsecaea erecta]|uniref:Ketoreductase domain-containing protein n=1 Tax=Fonsecaea erecta TaxID=1367422 RepID=A0A178ZEL5_9EURO|nr:hypothetical protein AYL99_08664 [Fonsecaea erecta]OAP57926.1 hypothetical protein AYL99_08664 [Fonsecaea erecta]
MASTPAYENRRVECQAKVDFDKVAGKTVVITGGSSGLGLCYVLALVKAGAFVVNGDIKPPSEALSSDRAVFVQCDVTSWEEQENLFKVAKNKSPNGGIDVVIANAGIYGPDTLDGLSDDEPKKPVTKLLDVNLRGVIYTSKLGGWYFHHQDGGDRCLILVSSIMGYIDTQGSSVYSAAKHGVRGLMTCLRRKGLLRVNCIAPWFVATPILPESFIQNAGSQFRGMGVDFATTDDAVTAVFRLITDSSINGRTLGIVPRQMSPSGYLDLDRDDFEEGTSLHKLQT